MDLIEQLEQKKKQPLPTPDLGQTVQWFENNDLANPRAAIVTKIEEPGRVALTVFSPSAVPRHVYGCCHVSHSVHQTKHNNQTFRSGSWNYLPSFRVPKEHFEPHQQYLSKRIESALEEQRKQEAAKESRRVIELERRMETVDAK